MSANRVTLFSHKRGRGLTLVELVVSMLIMTILMTAMTSALVLASHALPNDQSPLTLTSEASSAVGQIAGELFCASSILMAAGSEVIFTVPDRGHGAVGPETIRYAWSAAPGDPLIRQYNGGAEVNLCEDVRGFSLVYTRSAAQLREPPTVLLVVDNDLNPGAQDIARQTTMESWGFPVQLISAGALQADFDTAVTTCGVAYISETVLSPDLGTKLRGAAIGVVNEEGQLYGELGISADASFFSNGNVIDITDNTHEITSVFPAGALTFCSSTQQLLPTSGTLATGAKTLAIEPSGGGGLLVAIEVDGGLYGGGQAAARRVKLPWGNSGGFSFNALNNDGLTLMRRSIAWAAAPVVYTGVQVTLQIGADSGSSAQTAVQTFNTPSAK